MCGPRRRGHGATTDLSELGARTLAHEYSCPPKRPLLYCQGYCGVVRAAASSWVEIVEATHMIAAVGLGGEKRP